MVTTKKATTSDGMEVIILIHSGQGDPTDEFENESCRYRNFIEFEDVFGEHPNVRILMSNKN